MFARVCAIVLLTLAYDATSGPVYENNPFLQVPATSKLPSSHAQQGDSHSNVYVVLPSSGQQLHHSIQTPTVTSSPLIGVQPHVFDCANRTSTLHVHHPQEAVVATHGHQQTNVNSNAVTVAHVSLNANTPELNRRCLRSTGLFLGSSCSKFVSCLNGTATELSCPDGLLFNADGLYCDRPENVQCDGQRSAGVIDRHNFASSSTSSSPIHANLVQLSIAPQAIPTSQAQISSLQPGQASQNVATSNQFSQSTTSGVQVQNHNSNQHQEQQNHYQHQQNQQQYHQQHHTQQNQNNNQQYQYHQHSQQQHEQQNHQHQHHHNQQSSLSAAQQQQYQEQQHQQHIQHQLQNNEHNQYQQHHEQGAAIIGNQQHQHQEHHQHQGQHQQQYLEHQHSQHEQSQQQQQQYLQQNNQYYQNQQNQQGSHLTQAISAGLPQVSAIHASQNQISENQQQNLEQHYQQQQNSQQLAQHTGNANSVVETNQISAGHQSVDYLVGNTQEKDYGISIRCLSLRGQFPSDACHTFLNCWGGVATEQVCPDGLLFNTKGYCDFAENVNCAGRRLVATQQLVVAAPIEVKSPTPSSSSTSSFTPTVSPVLVANPTTPYTPTVVTLPAVAAPELKDKCLSARGQFPSTLCNKFVNCWDSVILEQECPEGFLFSTKGYCDFAANVQCGERPVDSKYTSTSTPNSECPLENGTFRDKNKCNTYYTCVANKVVARYECPEGLNYNDYIGVCDFAYRVDCSKEPLIFPQRSHIAPHLRRGDQCPADFATYRDAQNCGIYYTCVSKTIVATYKCPAGFSFNDDIGVCDYADRVDCTRAPKIFQVPNNVIPEITQDLKQKLETCTPGTVFSLNPQCTSVCICRQGVAEIVQCPAGLAYDSKTDKCILPHLAKC